MTFDAISRFVGAKPLALDRRVTGVFYGLRVNNDQRCPGSFF